MNIIFDYLFDHQVPNPDVYSGPWGGSGCRDSPVAPGGRECECVNGSCLASDKYLDQLENVFKFSLPNDGKIAAFIAESIQVGNHSYNYKLQWGQRIIVVF